MFQSISLNIKHVKISKKYEKSLQKPTIKFSKFIGIRRKNHQLRHEAGSTVMNCSDTIYVPLQIQLANDRRSATISKAQLHRRTTFGCQHSRGHRTKLRESGTGYAVARVMHFDVGKQSTIEEINGSRTSSNKHISGRTSISNNRSTNSRNSDNSTVPFSAPPTSTHNPRTHSLKVVIES